MRQTRSEYTRNNRYGRVWRLVFERDKVCVLCKTSKNLCIDHIVSVAKGGKSVLENMRVLCKTCNTLEGARCRELLMDEKHIRDRERKRRFRERHPGYFTRKSKEFRDRNPGYGTLRGYGELYLLAKV